METCPYTGISEMGGKRLHAHLQRALDPAKRKSPKMSTKEDPRDSLRILLAEDNPCDPELMMWLLRHMGLRADFAGNGLEVLDFMDS